MAAMNSSTDAVVRFMEGESAMAPNLRARRCPDGGKSSRRVRARSQDGPVNAQTPPALVHPLRTERLTLRPATADDADATWAFRRVDEVNTWLTGRSTDVEQYREHFADPARLAVTAVIQLGHGPTGPVIGDLMLRREDAWGQREVEDQAAGTEAEICWVLDPAHTGRGYATEAVRELLRAAFEEHGCAASSPTASTTTRRPGGSWSGSGCGVRHTRCATPCTAAVSGSTRWPTHSSPRSGGRRSTACHVFRVYRMVRYGARRGGGVSRKIYSVSAPSFSMRRISSTVASASAVRPSLRRRLRRFRNEVINAGR